MSNISSYYNNQTKNYIYQKTVFEASGASGVSGVSGTSGASGVSGVSGISGASGVYSVKTVKLADLNLSEITELFTTGNLTASELQKWLNDPKNKSKVTDLKTETKNNVVTFSFKYNNKQYTIACSKDAAASQTDNKKQELKTKTELENLGFTQADLSKYFIKASDYGTEKYALKPDCGYKTIADLAKAVKQIHKKEFQEAQSNLIMQNFINGKVTYKSEYTNKQFENATALKRTSDGTTISSKNYEQYADEISKATDGSAEKLRKEALQKFVKDFAMGNVAYNQASTILNAIGVKNYTHKLENGNYNLSFDFEGEHYSITCNEAAAKSGVDDVKVYNFESMDEEFKTKYKEDINLLYQSNGYKIPKEELTSLIVNAMTIISQIDEEHKYAESSYNSIIKRAAFFLKSYDTNQIISENRESISAEDRSLATELFSNVTGILDDQSCQYVQSILFEKICEPDSEEDIPKVRMFISIMKSLSEELQIPDSITQKFCELEKHLEQDEPQEAMDYFSDWKLGMTTVINLLRYPDSNYNIQDIISALDDIDYSHGGYALYDYNEMTKFIESMIGEVDGSFQSVQDALDIGLITLDVLEVLNDNGYTKDDLYGENGLLENGTLQLLVTMTKLSGNNNASMLEIDTFISNLSSNDRSEPFANREILIKHINNYQQDGSESIFSPLNSLMDAYYQEDGIINASAEGMAKAAQRLVNLCDDESFKTDMMKYVAQQMRMHKNDKTNVSYEDFSNIFSDAYKNVAGEDAEYSDYISSTLASSFYTELMRNYIGIDSNISDEAANEIVGNFVSQNSVNWSDVLERQIYLESTSTKSKFQDVDSWLDTNLSNIKSWDKVKKALTLDNILKGAGVLTFVCPPAGVAVSLAKNIIKFGKIGPDGEPCKWNLKNVGNNLPQILLKTGGTILSTFFKPEKLILKIFTKKIYNIYETIKNPEEALHKISETVSSVYNLFKQENSRKTSYGVEAILRLATASLYPAALDKDAMKLTRKIENGKITLDDARKKYDKKHGEGSFDAAYEQCKKGLEIEAGYIAYYSIQRSSDAKIYIEDIMAQMYAEGYMSEEVHEKYLEQQTAALIAKEEERINALPSMTECGHFAEHYSYDEEGEITNSESFMVYRKNTNSENKNDSADTNTTDKNTIRKGYVDHYTDEDMEFMELLRKHGIGVTSMKNGNNEEVPCYDADMFDEMSKAAKSMDCTAEKTIEIYELLIKKGYTPNQALDLMQSGTLQVAYGDKLWYKTPITPTYEAYLQKQKETKAEIFRWNWEAGAADREAQMLYNLSLAEFGDMSAYDAYRAQEDQAFHRMNELKHDGGAYDIDGMSPDDYFSDTFRFLNF